MARSRGSTEGINTWKEKQSSQFMTDPFHEAGYKEGLMEGDEWSERWSTIVIPDDEDDEEEEAFYDDEDDYDDKREEEQWKTIMIMDEDDDDVDDDEWIGEGIERICEKKGVKKEDATESVLKGLLEFIAEENPWIQLPEGMETGGIEVTRCERLKLLECTGVENPSMVKESIGDDHTRPRFTDNNTKSQNKSSNCAICFSDQVELLPRRLCCSLSICHSCFQLYLKSQIDNGNVRISCPNYDCYSELTIEEIRLMVDPEYRSKFDGSVTKAAKPIGLKTCPQCNTITVVSERILDVTKQKSCQLKIVCPVCDLVWCYDCESPYHSDETCQKNRVSDKKFKNWTKRHSERLRNARQCPKCRTYIQKSGGCNHMVCRQCQTRFCYKCGRITEHPATHSCSASSPKTETKGCGRRDILLIVLASPLLLATAVALLPALVVFGGYELVRAIRVRRKRRKANRSK